VCVEEVKHRLSCVSEGIRYPELGDRLWLVRDHLSTSGQQSGVQMAASACAAHGAGEVGVSCKDNTGKHLCRHRRQVLATMQMLSQKFV
jgi:hypothetical protein